VEIRQIRGASTFVSFCGSLRLNLFDVKIVPIALLATFPALAVENPRLEFAKGLLDQARGDFGAANERFEKARLADPIARPLVERAAQRRMAAGDLAGAVTLYREWAGATPDRLPNQLAYVDFLRDQGRGDAVAEKLATSTLESALRRFPNHPLLLDRLFRASEARSDRARSLALFESLLKAESLSPDATLMAVRWSAVLFPADDAAARERLDRLFSSACAASPGHRSLARAASEHFRKTGRTDRAIELLVRHAEANPVDLDLRTRLGILRFSAKRPAEAIKTLEAVLEIDPNRALAHESLAKFYRQENQPDPARRHADAVLKIRGGSQDEFLELGEEWLAANEPKKARILLEKGLFDHPDSSGLAEKLSIASRRDPETRARAARLFREAEALRGADTKPDPAFLVEFAEALIEEGQPVPAEERLRQAIRAYPATAKKESATAMRRLAGLWETQGKNADAARSLRQRADALDPPEKL
jgi:tetratricopeptide (TPR) repeat protein